MQIEIEIEAEVEPPKLAVNHSCSYEALARGRCKSMQNANRMGRKLAEQTEVCFFYNILSLH